MKQIVLLRHAKSSWSDSALDDHQRPLSARGLRDAPRMGQRLADLGIRPDLLLTSTATRAMQTAGLVAPALADGSLQPATDSSLYLATPGEILRVLSKLDDACRAVVAIGHNPGLTQLANMMLPQLRLDNLPTAGAVAINCDIDHWRNIDQFAFELDFLEYPKNLPDN